MIDVSLIIACKQQDAKAQRAVYDILLPKLYASCKNYLDSDADIEDVLSEVFVIIFSKIHQLEIAEALVAWSRKIAVHQCLAFIRKRQSFEELTEAHEQNDNVPNTAMENDIYQLVNLLPTNSKMIFNLAVVEGYSHKEIAHLLQISEGTSKSQLHYAKSKLKTWLQRLEVL